MSDAPPSAANAPVNAQPPKSFERRVSQQTHHDASDDACVICLEAISERATTIPCKHQHFDFICIVSWLHEQPSCPLCKATVTEVWYDWRAPDNFKRYKLNNVALKHQTTSAAANFATGTQSRPFRRSRNVDIRRRRQRAEETNLSEDVVLLRRRYVYRHGLYSLHVGANRISRFRVITPQFFASDAELQSRARMWIRRELKVFSFLNPNTELPSSSQVRSSNVEFLLEYIIAILKTVDMKDASGQAEDMLQEFLGRENARLFIHELGAWLRSPFTNVRDWDRNVQYEEPLPSDFVDGEPKDRRARQSDNSVPRGRATEFRPTERRYQQYSRSRHQRRGYGRAPD